MHLWVSDAGHACYVASLHTRIMNWYHEKQLYYFVM